MNLQTFECEYIDRATGEWREIGFELNGNWMPYRYGLKVDAETTAKRLYPDVPTRVVKAESVLVAK